MAPSGPAARPPPWPSVTPGAPRGAGGGGWAGATEAIRVAIAEAFGQAGMDPARTVAAASFGLAGMDRPRDAARYEAWIVRQGFARRHTIVNDAELVLAAGTADGWGVS